eukprot:7234122-Prymnesium_polylepis.1
MKFHLKSRRPPATSSAQLSFPKAARPLKWVLKHVVRWGELNSMVGHPFVPRARTDEISPHTTHCTVTVKAKRPEAALRAPAGSSLTQFDFQAAARQAIQENHLTSRSPFV